MPMELSRNELAKVMSGDSIGVTRYYPNTCPHEPGSDLLLSYGIDPATRKPAIIAKAKVVGVRPFEMRERRAATAEAREEARKEGWASPAEWEGHFERMYGELPDEAILYRVQFRIEERVENVMDSGSPMPMLDKK